MLNRIISLIILISILFSISFAKAESFGIICVPVANLRETASHKSELNDQEIMGYTVKLLKSKGNWCQVQTEYGYVGWMTDKSFCKMDEAGIKKWEDSDKVIVTKIFAIIYSQPNEQSQPVTNVVLNVLLQRIDQKNGWTKVCTPDGRAGFLRNDNISAVPLKKLSREQLRQGLVKTAKSMMGAAYLWGGKSSIGCDCSGFTQTVYRANGINILRDSRKQVTMGETVDYNETFANIQAGDLLFFGIDKITHVGMSLGGTEFIHQSGDVHINSLDPNAANYSEYHRKNLKAIRRICK